MFYSHQLLARKASLGQIWMAATMHAKMNRRKLDKLNIIKICEEILNPSVPMALRLSGILMGGVVIVYERKVKLLYDDVTRLVVELNEAWKVKSVRDPTVLPKGKTHARKEAITLPENHDTDVGDIENSLNFSNTDKVEFQQTAYFSMRLDDVDESYIKNNNEEDNLEQGLHQADAENITLFERFDSFQTHTNMYNRFERFDIDGDDEMQTNFTSGEHMGFPTTLVPSPPPQDDLERANENQDQHPNFQTDVQSEGYKPAKEDEHRQGPIKRKARKLEALLMDYEQTMIPGNIYQSWLQNTSDISSRRGRKKKGLGFDSFTLQTRTDLMSTMKLPYRMQLPPVVLMDNLFTRGTNELHYPKPLFESWMKSTKASHEAPPAKTSPQAPPEEIHGESVYHHDQAEYPFEDLRNGVGSQSLNVQREKLRENDISMEDLLGRVRANLMDKNIGLSNVNMMVTPGNSGDDVRSIPSSTSGHGVFSNAETNSERANKKVSNSSSRHGSNGLAPVAEENSLHLPKLPENGLIYDREPLMETGPTQTQHYIINNSEEKMTDCIRTQMKTHFETPGSAEVESLNKLSVGMNKKAAAQLFYQTCVLASRDVLRVEQRVPYGDIFISKGVKM